MTLQEALQDGNVKAFLAVIRAGEGTSDEDGYRRMFTGPLFDSFADHPRQLHTSGHLSSTAAGAYQFLSKTWDGLVAQYHFPDFSPSSQDLGAVALIKGRKALNDVIAGNIVQAIKKCALEWASLPGSPYGQPTRTIDQALETYRLAGGYLRPAGTPAPVEDSPVLPIIPLISAALPYLTQAAPALIRIFGDSPQAEKNAKAAEIVAGIAKDVTQETTVEGAVSAMQADPEKAAAFRVAVQDKWFEMTETGSGGIDGARKADIARMSATDKWSDVFKSHSFWIALLLLPLVYIVLFSIIGLVGSAEWSNDVRASIAGMIVGGIVGGLMGYYFGQTTSRNRTPG